MQTDWLLDEILTGMQKLLCLGLERQPAAEVLPGTAAAWVEALTVKRAWDRERDTPRIRSAFVTLAKQRRSWPLPADFDEALPRLEPNERRLGRPLASPAHVKRMIAEITQMLRLPT